MREGMGLLDPQLLCFMEHHAGSYYVAKDPGWYTDFSANSVHDSDPGVHSRILFNEGIPCGPIACFMVDKPRADT